MRTSEADVHELQRRAEAARGAAERALLCAREALDENERARMDAEAGQLAAEWAELVAVAARQAAEEARDAAEEGRAVAELAAREARLAQANLQNFLAMAAHDLHNPISGILGYAQLLQRKRASPEMQAHALSAIERSALQMSRLIQDLVDAGHAGTGSFSLSLRSTDLVALVHEAAEGLGQTSARHRIVVDAPEPIVGNCDADRLGQVVTNLVANAIKYSPEGAKSAFGCDRRATRRWSASPTRASASERRISRSCSARSRAWPTARSSAGRGSGSTSATGSSPPTAGAWRSRARAPVPARPSPSGCR